MGYFAAVEDYMSTLVWMTWMESQDMRYRLRKKIAVFKEAHGIKPYLLNSDAVATAFQLILQGVQEPRWPFDVSGIKVRAQRSETLVEAEPFNGEQFPGGAQQLTPLRLGGVLRGHLGITP